MQSGDDIRRDPVFEGCDLVFEVQLLFFQPPDGQHIGGSARLKGVDRIIEIAVFRAQNREFDAQDFKLFHSGRAVHGDSALSLVRNPKITRKSRIHKAKPNGAGLASVGLSAHIYKKVADCGAGN